MTLVPHKMVEKTVRPRRQSSLMQPSRDSHLRILIRHPEKYEEHVHKEISRLREKLQPFWSSLVRKSWILMIDETRTLVGCKA